MKRVFTVFLAILLLFALVSCQPESEPEEKSEPESSQEISQPPAKKDPPVSKEISKEEVPEESEETSLPEELPTVDPPLPTLEIRYRIYDYVGVSHEVLLTDPAEIQRVMTSFEPLVEHPNQAPPTMGGAQSITITQNGVTREYYLTTDSDETGTNTIAVANQFSEERYLASFVIEEGLGEDLFHKYYQDAYRYDPPYSYEVTLVHSYVEKRDPSTGLDAPIFGQYAAQEVTDSGDLERIQAALASREPAPKKDFVLEEVPGDFLEIHVTEKRVVRTYFVKKDADGTVIFSNPYVMSDENLPPDTNWYLTDSALYDDLFSSYFG